MADNKTCFLLILPILSLVIVYAASDTGVDADATTTTMPDVSKMSMKTIKAELLARRVVCTGCTEKSEFAAKLRENWAAPIPSAKTKVHA